MDKEANIYYDKGPCLSFHAFLNFLLGMRGCGKTYGFKTWSIDDFLKNNRQFMWVRRYGEEIKEMKKTFFDDVISRYPEHKFKIEGDKTTGRFFVDDKICGFYVALSTSSKYKSSSFPLVDKIIFDEFLIIGKTYHYLSDEVTMLLELISTVFRNREFSDDPNVVKPRGVYLLGNNVTCANPYFLYFNIKSFRGRFFHDKERNILVEMYTDTRFINRAKKSLLGQLTKGTNYSEYAIENKAYLDNDEFIGKRTPVSKFYCAIDYKSKTYGIWMDFHEGRTYVDYEYDPSSYNN